MSRFSSRIRYFLSTLLGRENGNLTVDTVIIFPVFVWAVTLTYSYFDGFRESTANVKAAYTVSDLISREGEFNLTDTYAVSLYNVFNQMVRNNSPLKMRLSFVRFKEGEEEGDDPYHSLVWTTRCGYEEEWSDDNIDQLVDALPEMAVSDTLIIVETSKEYVPRLNTSWLTKDYEFDNLVFTRPRFTLQITEEFSPVFCSQEVAPVEVAG